MPLISVTKCHGTGNDFLLLDARAQQDAPYGAIAKALCPRRLAIGADGLLVLRDPQMPSADAAMRIFNADGSEAEMCGNGIRCVARYLYEENPKQTDLTIETGAGLMKTKIVTWNGRPGARVSMGVPKFIGGADGKLGRDIEIDGKRAPAYAVSMGNPHIVVLVSRDQDVVSLQGLAASIQSWDVFSSEPNVEVAHIRGDEIVMRVHERGVGETWACGTGACAVAVVAIASGRARSPVTVTTKGGSVCVTWPAVGEPALLTGDAELVFRTEMEIPVEAGRAVISH